MLGQWTIFATIAVKDLQKAKEFYGNTLELEQTDENPGGVTYKSGSGKLFIYEAPTAGTNQATSASWEVDNINEVVAQLKAKGITFEKYDLPGTTQEGDISVMGSQKAAWFKDPDGNTLALGSH